MPIFIGNATCVKALHHRIRECISGVEERQGIARNAAISDYNICSKTVTANANQEKLNGFSSQTPNWASTLLLLQSERRPSRLKFVTGVLRLKTNRPHRKTILIMFRFGFIIALEMASLSGCMKSNPNDQHDCIALVREFHGAAGPWAVAGFRIGERALKELNLPRQSFSLAVVHYSPAEVQYSCIADGVQAATGASLGKLNLRIESAAVDDLRTVVEDRKTGRRLTFKLQPKFVQSILDVPTDKLESEGQRVAGLPDDEIFTFAETTSSSNAEK
ncbi:MAG TPA: formylmethanofuran dehydrogenase subunit E family protein [Pirellulales bacterium]|nr:formylmethanofuran dehydrogenase subunit E family protein [Pirellulales bacterium]